MVECEIHRAESRDTSGLANVSITAEELLASFTEDGIDEAVSAELHDRFMGLWQEKRTDGLVSMKEVRWIYGVDQPETLTEEEIVELEKQPEPLTEEELAELANIEGTCVLHRVEIRRFET